MNIPIWTGTSTFAIGQTPFGFYDNQLDFQTDSDKVSDFCARRLGYPLADVELQSGSFYTAFEEAITIYGNELYAYKVRENYLSLQGASSNTIPNGQLITPNLASIVRISEQYGAEAGVGGNVTWYSGSLSLKNGKQSYNMNEWAANYANLAANDSIEIKRIFYEAPPAITRYFDPYAGTGTGMIDLMDSFGWGAYSPAINFLMMPLNYDLAVMQAIEMNDMIRRSNYSFELVNNNLKVFPIPKGGSLWFEYIKKSERNNPYSNGTDLITDVSEVPFQNPNYNNINSIGRQWIFEMTLAISKEILGYIRGKYSTIPIPDSDVTLNQQDLLSSATADKTALIERLRAYFDETSRDKLLERRSLEGDYLEKELNKVPRVIFIG
mgnify:CR=1 FL=1|tara:strand:+ start:4862 stop:6004 length:1143 start_codon:yes stop_codon:yes gene_type:complete